MRPKKLPEQVYNELAAFLDREGRGDGYTDVRLVRDPEQPGWYYTRTLKEEWNDRSDMYTVQLVWEAEYYGDEFNRVFADITAAYYYDENENELYPVEFDNKKLTKLLRA